MKWKVKLEAKSGLVKVETMKSAGSNGGLTADKVGLTFGKGKELLREFARLFLQTPFDIDLRHEQDPDQCGAI